MGDNLSRIFHLFMGHGIKVNLVEASAVSIDVCVDDERGKVDALLETLKDEYSAVYNENVEMLSVRHYTPEAVERITTRTGNTARTADKEHCEVCGKEDCFVVALLAMTVPLSEFINDIALSILY